MENILHTNGVLDPTKVAKFLRFKYKLICCAEGIYYFRINGCCEHADPFYLGELIKYAIHEDLNWGETTQIELVIRKVCFMDLGLYDDDSLSLIKGLNRYKHLCEQGGFEKQYENSM